MRITPAKARNTIAVVKVIAPAVLPVITPYLASTAGTVRDRWDRMRARRLGVPVQELAFYTGAGGALHARIAGAVRSLKDVEDEAYTRATETKLRQLAAVVRAAERMPGPQRRSAQRAVGAELHRIENEILKHFGI